MPLTVNEIKHFKPKEKPYRKSDGNGLYIEIHSNGSKYWRWKYRYHGKTIQFCYEMISKI